MTAAGSQSQLDSGIAAFDTEHGAALQRLWFLGDVHGDFRHVQRCMERHAVAPTWLVFVGDLDLPELPLRAWVDPLRARYPQVRVAFIHGNHDADTQGNWDRLHDCGDAVALHGQVLTLDGVRVAGLGGVFMDRVWMPPAQPNLKNRNEALRKAKPEAARFGQPSPKWNAAIYPDDCARLAKQWADILVTHEAPSCHHHGFQALDELARSMRVVRSFHG